MAKICVGYEVGSGYKCERAATVTVIAGCIHEHVGPRDACDWHAGDVEQGRMLCGTCLDADGHHCVLHEMAREAVAARG